MSKIRMAGFAGLLVIAALVGGTVIGSVAATSLVSPAPRPASGAQAPSASGAPNRAAAAEYCAAAFPGLPASQIGVRRPLPARLRAQPGRVRGGLGTAREGRRAVDDRRGRRRGVHDESRR